MDSTPRRNKEIVNFISPEFEDELNRWQMAVVNKAHISFSIQAFGSFLILYLRKKKSEFTRMPGLFF